MNRTSFRSLVYLLTLTSFGIATIACAAQKAISQTCEGGTRLIDVSNLSFGPSGEISFQYAGTSGAQGIPIGSDSVSVGYLNGNMIIPNPPVMEGEWVSAFDYPPQFINSLGDSEAPSATPTFACYADANQNGMLDEKDTVFTWYKEGIPDTPSSPENKR